MRPRPTPLHSGPAARLHPELRLRRGGLCTVPSLRVLQPRCGLWVMPVRARRGGGASPSPRTRRIHSAWCLPSQCRPSSHLELRPADVVDGAVCPASGAGWALPAGDSGRLPLEKLARGTRRQRPARRTPALSWWGAARGRAWGRMRGWAGRGAGRGAAAA